MNLFIGNLVKDERGQTLRIDTSDASLLNNTLMFERVADAEGRLTEEGREMVEQNKVPLPPKFEPYRNDIVNILKSVYSGEVLKPENDRDTVLLTPNANFKKKEFLKLWNRINLKTIYEVNFNSDKLIIDSRTRINGDLHIGDRLNEVKTGELQAGSKQQMEEKSLFKDSGRQYGKLNADIFTNTVYDIVGEIVNKTNLTRRTVVAILKAISTAKFLLVRKNPEEFISKVSKLINEVKASLIINNIIYHITDSKYDAATVFTNGKFALRQSSLLRKHIYDYLTTDSKIETKFAEAPEYSLEVDVYAKLPKSFYITTPVANYSPDWAIVFDKEKARHIYFVAETKGTESDLELREIEKLKIHCADKHFKTIGGNEVQFHKVSSYDKLLEIIQIK